MAHCFQFISPTGKALGLNQLDNDIRREVFGLPPDDDHFYGPFMLVQLLTSPGGLQPIQMANEEQLPECVRQIAEYLVRREITSRGWQEGADGRLIRWITPRDDDRRRSTPRADVMDADIQDSHRERRWEKRRMPSCPDSF